MNKPKYKTIGELKKSGYHSKTLNQEITDKRQKKIKEKKEAGQKSLIARFLLGIRF